MTPTDAELVIYYRTLLDAANKDRAGLEGRARYWRQRAKSAEGHLWGSDHEAAERAVHAASVLQDTPWDDLTSQQRWAVSRVVSGTIAAINGRRHARLPKAAIDRAREAGK